MILKRCPSSPAEPRRDHGLSEAKRCADILQSLVEEVEENISSTIYRDEPLQPLAMPPDMDKSASASLIDLNTRVL